MNQGYEELLNFWFEELTEAQYWVADPSLDEEIERRFSGLHLQATQGELAIWRASARGCLAEIILLDQVSRCLFRGRAESFAYDGMALVLAQESVRREMDQALPADMKRFLYMPYMHSESAQMHEEALRLFAQPGLEQSYDYELKHKQIIDRHGRYPHRNRLLGRTTTSEEQVTLDGPDGQF